MKQTLLIITFFIGLGNVNAQDASNDATWKETTSFILKHSSSLKSIYNTVKYDNFKIKDSILYFRETYDDKQSQQFIPLNRLTPRSYNDDGSEVTFAVTSLDYCKCQKTWAGDKMCKFQVSDSELAPRLRKAIRHLSILAKEKRENDRKTQGEKF